MNQNLKKTNKAWYALRRTLPVVSFEKNLRELIEMLPKYRVDELILKVDVEAFWHGQPDYGWIKKYQKKIFLVKKEMEKLGIVFSLNPWITVGHGDYGKDARKQLPGFQPMVGHDGTECSCCACPLGEVWKKNTEKIWSLYAETKPAVIWAEDDLRIIGHNPVEWSCFCPLHMKLFSERIGRSVTRTELVKAILSPGKPHPWRIEYLKMQGDVMAGLVRFLAKTVHRISPATCMGLMSSGPAYHCVEGRPWKRFAGALADGNVLYSRPPMGSYSESSLRGLYYSANSIKSTRYCLPKGVVEQTEVENCPFTKYSNSVAYTFLEIAVSFAFGCDGVTMNLFDHTGTAMEAEPEYGKMLAEKKNFLNALAEKSQAPGELRGVKVLHHDKAGSCNQYKENGTWAGLQAEGHIFTSALEPLGIPTVYQNGRGVTAACGQILRPFSDKEIKEMLSGGLLLDGTAALVLYERGFGAAIGLKSISEPARIDELGPEEFYNPEFGGEKGKYLTLTFAVRRPHICRFETLENAKVISRIVDADANRHAILMYAFENRKGERVVVSALDIATSFPPRFNNPSRARQLKTAVKWLSRDKFPMFVEGGAYPLCLRKDMTDGTTLLGLFNLSLDPWPHAQFELYDERKIKKISVLTQEGKWKDSAAVEIDNISANTRLIKYGEKVAFPNPLFLSVRWA